MKITSVEPVVVGTQWRNYMFLEVKTDEGLTGVGECTVPNQAYGMLEFIKGFAQRHVIGRDPFNIEALWDRMYCGDFLRRGFIHQGALSGIDIACYDIMGQALGVPVWKLVGGATRDKVPLYANAWYTVERRPEDIARQAKEAVLPLGYKALKIDPFGPGRGELSRQEFGLSVDIIAALREAVGAEVEIFVEGHARFTVAQAKKIAKAIEPYEPGWFEEVTPWDDIGSWAEVRASTTIPIAGGEHFQTRHEYRDVFERRCLDIVQADILVVGGFTELRKVAAWADAYGLLMAPHNSQGPVCNTATGHLCFGLSNFKVQECFDDFIDPVLKEVAEGCLPVKDGYLELPAKPGLGITLNLDAAKEHPMRPILFNLWESGWEKRDV